MIKVYLNRKVSETQITIGNQYESGVNAIDFDLSELKEKWPNGNIYLLVSRKKHTWPYSIDDGEFKVEYVLTWKRGFYQMNVVVTDEKITDQLESSNTIFVSDTINAYVNENQINAKALNEQELPRELQIVYDDLITLKKNIEKDLADGKYIGPQGPKGEPGDVTEEYRNLASQIAQNASDAQTSATNAQVSATNAQKALDDTKDFVNQTKTELNQIKTDTRALKDEANTSAVNAQASATSAQESATSAQESATSAQVSATNAQKILDDTKTFANQAISEVNQIKTDTNTLKDEANTSAVNAKASEDKAKEYADNLKESTDAISQNAKAISELADKKITKFYASNQGETHVSDSDKGLIQDMMIYGKSNQNQTKGKNLLKYPYIETTKLSMGITFTDNKDGSINVSGIGTEIAYYNLYTNSDGKRLTLASGTYKLVVKGRSKCNVHINNGINSAKNEETFTITDGHNDVWCFIEAPKGLAINETIYPMIQLASSTDESYEPYTGGKPSPSPDYPQEIKSVVNPTIKVIGNNLIKFDESFNSENFGITMIYEKGGIRMTGTATGDGNLRIIDPNKEIIKWNKNKYTVSLKATDVCLASLYVADAKNDEWELVAGVNINETKAFEKAIDVVGVFITFVKGETYDVLLYPQVEYGTQASKYESYKEQSIALPITLNAIPVSSGGNVTIDGQQYIADYVDVERGKIVRRVDSSKLDNTQSIIDKMEWLLAEQQETDLTTEQMQALKELATYYPVTNITVGSDQLDGYTVFNYPISMANGWNYVKQQLNDNRDYIYDMDLQSAEAYVNSEYAVTLTELEV
jgi:hypothetical protein